MLNELSCNYSSTSVGLENVMLRGETERERDWEIERDGNYNTVGVS